MRIFKTKPFSRFARHEDMKDAVLRDAIRRADQGLIDADLGGGVVKLRIPRRGHGRSGGYRSIVLLRRGERAFFVYGFAKKARANISQEELAAFRALASELLGLDDPAIDAAKANGAILEITDDA
jgi:hypothetical protein